MKTKIKRSLAVMMFIAVPLVSASPTSALQEVTVPVTATAQATAIVATPVIEKDLPISFGTASWYSETDAYINLRTANGEIFDDTKMTCASWYFPFKTRLRVTNLSNGLSVIVVVNDRGPAKRLGRVIDLTKSAYRKIADSRTGLIQVAVEEIID